MNHSKLIEVIEERVDKYEFKPRIQETGYVVSIGDGILWIRGLPSAAIDEILMIEDGSRAMVFHLADQLLGAILLEQIGIIKAGSNVYHLSHSLSIPVGDNLLGRVIDPLVWPLDKLPFPQCNDEGLLDILSPTITDRDFIHQPLYTGNKIMDNLVPIGKGQRELLIGDNGLGKSALALDIVINQKKQNVRCVYVLIGQKRSSAMNIIQHLINENVLDNTCIVMAEPGALPGLKYLAPFSGCAIAEYWMKKGLDTLIVYDDLTQHADSYRELSLLLKRPPGREAFPPDIFHLHARLLERSTCLSPDKGGGSMTAFPIIETREGEIASYIPTNLISITDGQVYFDEKLFSEGFLPAIDIKRSISRVGGKAQHPQIKKEAGRMKLDYLQFLDLEAFTRFGAKLDKPMKKKIHRGQLLREILKQNRLSPLPIEFQLAWLITYNDCLFDDILPENILSSLDELEYFVKQSELTIDAPREQWQKEISSWFEQIKSKKNDKTSAT